MPGVRVPGKLVTEPSSFFRLRVPAWENVRVSPVPIHPAPPKIAASDVFDETGTRGQVLSLLGEREKKGDASFWMTTSQMSAQVFRWKPHWHVSPSSERDGVHFIWIEGTGGG